MILQQRNNFYFLDDGGANKFYTHVSNLIFNDIGGGMVEIQGLRNARTPYYSREVISSITDANGTPYGTTFNELIFRINSPMETLWQDPVNPIVVAAFNQKAGDTTLAVAAAQGDRTITVVDGTGIVPGQYIQLFNTTTNALSLFYVTAYAANVVTLNILVDEPYPIGSPVDFSATDLAVNGLVTNQVFGLRGDSPGGIVNIAFDITQIIFTCLTAGAVDLNKFGDLAELAYGLSLRTRSNGDFRNLISFRSNLTFAGVTSDWQPYEATKPSQGQDGFTAKWTLSGQDNMGSVIRLKSNTDLELVVQDDLSGLDRFVVIAKGHLTVI